MNRARTNATIQKVNEKDTMPPPVKLPRYTYYTI